MLFRSERNSILCDVFEAILGAIYLDSDFQTARKIILNHLEYLILHIEEEEDILDFKTILQEYSQKEHKITPVYKVINEKGPDHKKTFEILVQISENKSATGVGSSKKMAEQAAAKALCKKMGVN